MAGIFQAPQLVSASRDYTYTGAGKQPLPDTSRNWTSVFGNAAASSTGAASRWNSDNQLAATIWSPSEIGETARQDLAGATGIGAAGLQSFGQTRSNKYQADALVKSQKRQAGSGWGGVLGGVLGIASSFLPVPKVG